MMHNGGVLFFEELRGDDDVGDAGLIFKAEKYKTFRGAGTLANNDGAGDLHELPIWKRCQMRCW